MTTSPESLTPTQAQALHLKAWNLIPWLVAGSASAAESAAFRQHAEGCEDCRAELAFQRRVQGAMQASALPAHAAEPALQRLQARIAIADSVAPLPLPPVRRGAGARGIGWTRAWAGVALLQAAGLVLLGSMLWSRSDGDAYRTLSNPTAVASPAATIRLVLSPQVSAGQMQGLLKRHRLAAVEISPDGASLGLATVGAADAAGASTAAPARTAAAVAALRAEPGVLLAETITTLPAR